MSWLSRFDMWLESRRVLRKSDLETIMNINGARFDVVKSCFDQVDKRIDALQEAQQTPPPAMKEVALLKARLDRIELLVGLKRDPSPVKVPDAPRIE